MEDNKETDNKNNITDEFDKVKEKDQKKKRFQLIRRDNFGNVLFLKRMLIGTLAALTYPRLKLHNNLEVKGMEVLKNLPNNNVLFISNHQTYYTDVISFYHIFSSAKWGFKKGVANLPVYMLNPRVNLYYVAAEETMKQSGIIPKIFSLAGAVTVKRSWRAQGKDVKRGADINAPLKIKKALDQGWLVTFPQGTTSPYAPVRKGTGNIIKSYNPIVVPIEIDGFRRAFDKKGLFFKKRGTKLKVHIKDPIQFAPDASVDEIVKTITNAIGQNPEDKPKFD
ncbi:lysophospholipid acyltransferase family protein [Flammeovirga kamogawensis]|uniref:1-acyl-sn-glycerol-3-phosphate acyltransferase n=1 Tax=Flammeovirga kamogawensis TaxID=373891 RepID=A0ABX8H0X6_9BACT|nr:lysophospholipid acyltransferase family protein [Flammeovirga kamogawensis]MBB6459407.1 1-acyl-sn-glycerol-3-phosphate acyltransferase [Flammeovirga kamogawensis]QWG08962.1 1-acyl-sn-glycerol-3-phosphate acyltransferase [Flammeovirga kamogawensis]TRX67252.1 1-acyl-sn-glycerol-3-phosphate acyltransferase [Flammeovirga kamogawensis]